ncbi:amino acid ABC transporter permease [Meiothermus sp. CFH 77666]|uniref:amino acid ABC transporter permease n=1 Tax=Meiothermus sp. CFH 77666 TaxID=2817942 RepID=UPI00325F98CC
MQTYLVAVGLMTMGLVLVALCVAAWFQGVEPLWSVILFGLLGVYMVFLGVDEGWLSGLEVTPSHLRIQSFGRWEEYPLTRIEAVDGLRDILGGGIQLVLLAAEGQAIRVPLRRYANAGPLAQALLDALWLQNKELVLMPRLARRLGQPPFGVFAAKKSGR